MVRCSRTGRCVNAGHAGWRYYAGMKERLICHACDPVVLFHAPTTTDRWVVTRCPSNHVQAVLFQSPGWARLFERGMRRIASEANRDGVIDAYTAFEMYLAHVPVRARYDREVGAKPEALRAELKPVLSTTDRAIASARMAASLIAKGAPPLWNDQWTAHVRNDAVHSGKHPQTDVAKRLCREIVTAIGAFEAVLAQQACVNDIPFHQRVYLDGRDKLRAAHPDLEITFYSGATMFGIDHTLHQSVDDSFAEYAAFVPRAIPITIE